MSPELSIPRRHARLADALADADARAELEAALPGYIRPQRWFGGRTRQLATARLERWVALPSGACLAVVAVVDGAGGRTEHQLALAAGEPEGARRPVRDALESGAARAELLAVALGGESIRGHRLSLHPEPTGLAAPGCGGEGSLLGVEQSNSSVAYDDACILKLYRRLERGPNPDAELGRYLSGESGFAGVPALLTTVRLEGPDGFRADALAVQRFVPNRGDGWAWALKAAGRALDAAAGPVEMRRWLGEERATLVRAELLGETTALLHATLAAASAPALRPEPATGEDAAAWREALRREAGETLRMIEAAGPDDAALRAAVSGIARGNAVREDGPPARARRARGETHDGGVLLGRAGGRAGRDATVDAPAVGDLDDRGDRDATAYGLKTRVHGDYHLGQVLDTDAGFVVLDFEGEPRRTLRERRALGHPLVDVAGMARSWQYAAHTAARERGVGASDAAAAWERAARERFVRGYLDAAAANGAPWLPTEPSVRDGLLRLFELTKALYEVRYELDNRPEWVSIPAAAVCAMATGGLDGAGRHGGMTDTESG